MIFGGLFSCLQVPGVPAIFYPFHQEFPLAKELSIFVERATTAAARLATILLTLIFHDQADSIAEAVMGNEAKLARTAP